MKLFQICTVAAMAAAGAANAGVVYNNPIQLTNANGDCSFSTTCAAQASRGDDFAAQKFTLASAEVIILANFTELDNNVVPTDVTWGIIQADGTGGLPGTILATGFDTLTAVSLGNTAGYNISQLTWATGGVALDAGTYYLAIKATSPVFNTFLARGVDNTGAAETHDGGVTWASGYQNIGGVSVELFGLPEPAAWTMMLVGFAGVGGAMRRRASAAAI